MHTYSLHTRSVPMSVRVEKKNRNLRALLTLADGKQGVQSYKTTARRLGDKSIGSVTWLDFLCLPLSLSGWTTRKRGWVLSIDCSAQSHYIGMYTLPWAKARGSAEESGCYCCQNTTKPSRRCCCYYCCCCCRRWCWYPCYPARCLAERCCYLVTRRSEIGGNYSSPRTGSAAGARGSWIRDSAREGPYAGGPPWGCRHSLEIKKDF